MLGVLIVDDEKLMLDELESCINWNSLGFSIVGRGQNGRDGLAILEKLSPDVIITDVKMPIMDGLVFTRKVRDRNRNVKIIIVSGYDEFDFAKRALSVEAFAYILKPVDTGELKEVLKNVKERCTQENALYHSNDDLVEKYLASLLTENNNAKKTGGINPVNADRKWASDSAERHNRIVQKALMILNENANRQLAINELADQLFISPSYLRTIFKEVTGDTVYDVQLRIKLDKAEKLLSGSNRKIKEIAGDIGFEYTSHFIALFTKYKGMTPLEYRNMVALKDGNTGDDKWLCPFGRE